MRAQFKNWTQLHRDVIDERGVNYGKPFSSLR